jgi:hypothetical protein
MISVLGLESLSNQNHEQTINWKRRNFKAGFFCTDVMFITSNPAVSFMHQGVCHIIQFSDRLKTTKNISIISK